MYTSIAAIFEQFVPLFEKVLTDLVIVRPKRVVVDEHDWYQVLNRNFAMLVTKFDTSPTGKSIRMHMQTNPPRCRTECGRDMMKSRK